MAMYNKFYNYHYYYFHCSNEFRWHILALTKKVFKSTKVYEQGEKDRFEVRGLETQEPAPSSPFPAEMTAPNMGFWLAGKHHPSV